MSVCISRHGEFSEHELDATFTCRLCHVVDHDALRAERDALAATVRRVRALVPDWQANGNSRELGDPTDRVWFECARQLLAALDGTGEEAT